MMSPKNVGAIFFDIGGVLAFPSGKSMAHIATNVSGVELEPYKCRDAVFRAGADAAKTDDPPKFWQSNQVAFAWARHAGLSQDWAIIVWEAILGSDTPNTPLWNEVNPEAMPTLMKLRQYDIPLIAVSNADGRLQSDLDRMGFGEFFSATVDSALVGISKPDPAIFDFAIEAIGSQVNLKDCWYVGDDTYFDVSCALKAGIGRIFLYDRLGLYGDSILYDRIIEPAELGVQLERRITEV